MQMTALDGWHDYLKTHDRAALRALLHPDAVFESPIVHTPQRGREITLKYLASAGKVLSGPGFSYRRFERVSSARCFAQNLQWDPDLSGVVLPCNQLDFVNEAEP